MTYWIRAKSRNSEIKIAEIRWELQSGTLAKELVLFSLIPAWDLLKWL